MSSIKRTIKKHKLYSRVYNWVRNTIIKSCYPVLLNYLFFKSKDKGIPINKAIELLAQGSKEQKREIFYFLINEKIR